MSRFMNERGYALLTVLLTIVLFMILFLAFMGQAFSSVKQNQQIEKNSKAVALAEAGITYYHTEIQSIYEAKQNVVAERLKLEMESDPLVRDLETYDETSTQYKEVEAKYKQLAADYMLEELESAIIENKTVPIEGRSDEPIQIVVDKSNIGFDTTRDEININYTSTGTEDSKPVTLTGQLTIHIGNPNLNDAESGPIISFSPPRFDVIDKPDVSQPECIDPSSLSAILGNGSQIGCTKVLIEGVPPPYDENLNNLDNKLIYAVNDLTINKNGNSAVNLKIFSKNLTIGQNVNNLETSTIETENDAVFNNNLTIHYSKLYVGGNLKVNGEQFALENSGNNSNNKHEQKESSLAYVRGNVILPKATIAEGTTMCVKGDLNAQTLDLSGHLYIQGDLYINGVLHTLYTNMTKVPPDAQNIYKTECGETFAPPELFIGWGDSVKNNVIYN
ncbi:hypothetical protein [Mesobacillus maritimus]|uniref:hypothetical protein n=1 Tax=Mesobacillus maritimus TaxID=1643336 RepID=UPI00384DC491